MTNSRIPLKVLVTGSNGQLASKLAAFDGRDGISVFSVGRPECDITDSTSVRRNIEAFRPDIVVNAAAYTAVDAAETDHENAFAVNRDGAGNVAIATADFGIPVIHISTDYVFSGDKTDPYAEDDETGPTGVYGQSKLEGERVVAAANPKHLIIRTAWVYSDFGKNFLKTMLRLAENRDELNVVADQFGNPTDAADLAEGVLIAARKVTANDGFSDFGVYHLTGSGSTNWSGFARQIFRVSGQRNGPDATVKDIATEDYPTQARRPSNSRLSNQKFARIFGWQMPDWQSSCERTVKALT